MALPSPFLSPPSKPPNPESAKPEEQEEEDDYLSMTFTDTTPLSSSSTTTARKKESLTQSLKRKQRESELRAHPKSRRELAQEEARKREEALATSTLDPQSKGFKMMAKLGYKAGNALGRPGEANGDSGSGLLEPVGVEMREGRAGIGADAEKKRKVREEMEARVEGEKRVKVEEGEFRERRRLEREERRREGLIRGAQAVAQRLEEGEEEEGTGEDGGLGKTARDVGSKKRTTKPLGKINVLWRGAVKQRELAERDKRMRYDLHQSLSRLPTYEDPDEDQEDRVALGKKDTEEVDRDLDGEDDELNEFEALDSVEKLQKLVQYLRERWHYCFWCKYRYGDSGMDGCPGTTEDDHD
ncbi:hypothetical protein EPUS_00407 [Endocarpon pusillum Z07020]|uniref:G-patch domain-containing protein n=1 Tax=Endocarpon pusillum (strain Z07020 / HMAS-L-300199) TaxID=1263415 RepID=U1HMI4_ENDPU|nr:uncharacterized protein EPUS_00407 [Endocarpon pusillum Z07020]ERF70219.1 hypothetical protein EPUS_00407 [Endocarpon pusillum Z07020]